MPGAGVHIVVDRVGGSEVRRAAAPDQLTGDHSDARLPIGDGRLAMLGHWTGRGARGRRASAARSAGPAPLAPKARLSQ
jgi:hypothetical protein